MLVLSAHLLLIVIQWKKAYPCGNVTSLLFGHFFSASRLTAVPKTQKSQHELDRQSTLELTVWCFCSALMDHLALKLKNYLLFHVLLKEKYSWSKTKPNLEGIQESESWQLDHRFCWTYAFSCHGVMLWQKGSHKKSTSKVLEVILSGVNGTLFPFYL